LPCLLRRLVGRRVPEAGQLGMVPDPEGLLLLLLLLLLVVLLLGVLSR
jgi:hypothetical protein